MSTQVRIEFMDRMRAFRTLTTPTAARLLLALADGPLRLGPLAARAGFARSYACTQLRALLLVGAVLVEREGRRATYRLNRSRRSTPARAVLRALELID
jgi:DNA-binding transcriptional ArsR family regulator